MIALCFRFVTGIPDILDLSDFSEMSLLNTYFKSFPLSITDGNVVNVVVFGSLRVRYLRDEVYTRVGPILISINPYKWNKTAYSEGRMIAYHQAPKSTV